MFGHWLLDSSVLDVQSMSCQTYVECILRFTNALNDTLSAHNQVHHVTRSTVHGGFHAKLRASCTAAKHNAHFIWTYVLQHGCLHWLFPLYISLCCLNAALTRRFLRLGGWWYATRGYFGIASLKRGDILMTHQWSQRMRGRWGRSGWKVTTSRVTCSLSFFCPWY